MTRRKSIPVRQPRWSAEEVATLLSSYPTMPWDELCAMLPKRNKGTIIAKARSVGVTRSRQFRIGDTDTTRVCSLCQKEKLLSEFGVAAPISGRLNTRCKACVNAHGRNWYSRSKEMQRAKNLRWKFGMTLDEYQRILTLQDGRCAICRCLPEEDRHGRFGVDHCHLTGAVRGLLCEDCNHVLGRMHDSPSLLARAIDYLVSPPVEPPATFKKPSSNRIGASRAWKLRKIRHQLDR